MSTETPPRKLSNTQHRTATAREATRLHDWSNLIKVSAWPLIVTVVLISNWRTISGIGKELPPLLSHATKLSAGGLSMEIKNQALHDGGTVLREAVTSLTPEAIEVLLDTDEDDSDGFLTFYGAITTDRATVSLADERKLRGLNTLEKSGMIAITADGKDMSVKEVVEKYRQYPRIPGSDRFVILHPGTDTVSRDEPRYSLTDLGRKARRSVYAAIDAQLSN